LPSAKIPDAFTVKYLDQTLGLKSTNDRQLIPLLKRLGFLDSSGKPTSEYAKLKGNKSTSGAAMAEAIRRAYAPLSADENAHDLPPDELKGLVAQVSGAEDQLIKFIVGTLNSLVKAADFTQVSTTEENDESGKDESMNEKNGKNGEKEQNQGRRSEFNPDFKFNIEIHLPSNGTEVTYLAIFNALRKSLG
jgi:hypothetical protein